MPISCHFTYSLNQIRKIVVALPSKLGTRFWDFIIRLHNRTSWAHERVMWSTLTMVTGQSVACTAYHTMAYNRLRYVRRQQVRAQRHQWPRERPTDRRADENRQPHPVTPWRHSRPVYSKATAGYTGSARPGPGPPSVIYDYQPSDQSCRKADPFILSSRNSSRFRCHCRPTIQYTERACISLHSWLCITGRTLCSACSMGHHSYTALPTDRPTERLYIIDRTTD